LARHGLLRRIVASLVPQSWFGVDADVWRSAGGVSTTSGVSVTADKAMSLPPVYACVRVISETLAMLPVGVFERMARGARREARDHELWPLLHDRPNRWQTAFEWREWMAANVALRGNAYSQIVRARGKPVELVPIHPDKIQRIDSVDGILRYHVQTDAGLKVLLQYEVLHVRFMSDDGVRGLSPVAVCRNAVGAALAADDYAAAFYANSAAPRGALKVPGVMEDDAMRKFREQWQAHYSGANAHRPAILENGMEWQSIGMSHEDAQFLETRGFGVEEVCRIYRVPPLFVQHSSNLTTYASAEQMFLAFKTLTMTPWFVRFESALERDLLDDSDRYFIEFNADGLMRGDAAARAAFYASALDPTRPWMSRNEVRRKENLDPVDGLDEIPAPIGRAPGRPADENGSPE
jgi:HK97 family phage portal protein